MEKLASLRARKRLLPRLTKAAQSLLATIAPPRCLGCLQEMTWLCPICRQRIGHFPLACLVCNHAHPRGLTCEKCRDATLLTGVINVGPYTSQLLQRGISWLKFKGITATAEPLAELVVPLLPIIAPLEQLREQAVLIPIPLHKQRLRERGFNQSAELARHLSRLTDIETLPLLDRPKATWTQSHLPKELRQQNVAGIFSYTGTTTPSKPLAILIDDVTTSGSTLTAAAYVLKRAGFPLIWGATIARG